MKGTPIEAINQSLPELQYEIGVNPRVSNKVRFGIIGFSTRAEVLLTLSDLSDVGKMPELKAAGCTNYGAAFDLLRETIRKDVKRLKSEHHAVFRPAVFFLSDGYPTDDQGQLTNAWTDAHGNLVSPGFTEHPNIIAFGIGECDPATIGRVGTVASFIQKDDSVSPAEALREFAAALTKSIIRSANRQDVMAEPRLVFDTNVQGFLKLDQL